MKIKRTKGPSPRGKDIVMPVSISFEEAALGSHINIEINKKDVCDSCEGSRSQENSKTVTCNTCKGEGITEVKKKHAHFQFKCETCKGLGIIIQHPCKECKGHGIAHYSMTEKIKVSGGTWDGEEIKLSKKVSIIEDFRMIIVLIRVMLAQTLVHMAMYI